MRTDTIRLTYQQWNRLGFFVKKGSKGTKTYSQLSSEHYYTFTEDQVERKETVENMLYATEWDLY